MGFTDRADINSPLLRGDRWDNSADRKSSADGKPHRSRSDLSGLAACTHYVPLALRSMVCKRQICKHLKRAYPFQRVLVSVVLVFNIILPFSISIIKTCVKRINIRRAHDTEPEV